MLDTQQGFLRELRALLRGRSLDLDLFDLRIHTLPEMPYEGGAGGADDILLERVALLGKAKRHSYSAVIDFDVLHHSEVHDVAVFPGGVMHFAQELSYFFYCHFTNSSSLIMLWASPHFSTIQST